MPTFPFGCLFIFKFFPDWEENLFLTKNTVAAIAATVNPARINLVVFDKPPLDPGTSTNKILSADYNLSLSFNV